MFKALEDSEAALFAAFTCTGLLVSDRQEGPAGVVSFSLSLSILLS